MPVLRPQTFVVEHASPWDAFAAVWLRFEGPKLMLLSSGGAWSLNGSSSAACPRPAFIPKHDPPSEDCFCGLYGEKTAEKVIEELSRLSLMSSWLKLSRPRIGPDWQAQGILVGKLKVWGKLIVTENYRFEHGRIVAFMPTPLQMQIVKDLEAQCDIPTSRWMWGRWLVGGPLNDRLLPVDALFPDAETVLIPAVARNLCRPPSTAIMSLPDCRNFLPRIGIWRFFASALPMAGPGRSRRPP
ncbi:MAG: hypothetical protein E6G40_11580 [Actinobacteria bacterium]|nr:MAG: hypothetical protein E6G40_11580 [Actinomycetota bacterium]